MRKNFCNMRLLQQLAMLALILAVGACSTIGHSFKSDPETLSRLQVGVTTPTQAIDLLGSEPYARQNLGNGLMTLQWQWIAANGFSGLTDNRSLVLQFNSDGNDWRFSKVLTAQNIDLPDNTKFGMLVNDGGYSKAPMAVQSGRLLGIICDRKLPNGDFLPIVTGLLPGRPAKLSGWIVGDSIVSVNGVQVSTLSDVSIETQKGGPVKIYVIRRNEREFQSTVDFREFAN